MKPPKPDVDVVKCAVEIKEYLKREKYNMIDSDSGLVEIWPPPDDPDMPEMGRFHDQHEEFFSYVATLEVDDDGNGYPFDQAEEFRSVIKEVKDEVNSDKEFWTELRNVVLPLYGKVRVTRQKDGTMTFMNLDDGKKSPWDDRWKSIDLFYDPFTTGLTNKMSYKNLRTGKIKEGSQKLLTDRSIPAGFVIRVM